MKHKAKQCKMRNRIIKLNCFSGMPEGLKAEKMKNMGELFL